MKTLKTCYIEDCLELGMTYQQAMQEWTQYTQSKEYKEYHALLRPSDSKSFAEILEEFLKK